MARKYSSGASKKVEQAMHERKEGTLKSGRSGKTVKSRKQAIPSGFPKPGERARKPRRRSRANSPPMSSLLPRSCSRSIAVR